MRTRVEYEASDINKEDPLHQMVMGLAMVVMLEWSFASKEIKEKAPASLIDSCIAAALNYIENSDYVLVKRER